MEDVDITIENDNLLVIKGHREREYNQSDSKGRTLERHFGEYKRTIQLPNNCDKNSPRAVLNNGVLTITFPKCEPTNIRKIPLEK
jgi:HSP20 family protein